MSENVFGIITNSWRIYRSPISLHSEQVRELIMAVLTLHNWLRSGQSKTVYMLPVIHMTRQRNHSFPVSGGKKINCLIQLQPLQHGNNPSVVAKKIREEFREYFSLERAVNWQWEYCKNQN